MANGTQKRRETVNNAYNSFIQNGYYSYTSEAYKLAEAAAEESAPVRRKVKANPTPVKKPRHKQRPEYVMVAAPLRRMSFLSVFTMFVLLAGSFACLFSFAMISQKQLEINRLGKELKTSKEKVISLAADTETLYTAEEISTLAQTKLGMSKPKDYQIVEIEIPRTSYFVQYDYVSEPEPVKLSLAGIIELFLK